jgi:hypothetical protein
VWCHCRSSLYERKLVRNHGVFTSFPPILLILRCLNLKSTNQKTNKCGYMLSGETWLIACSRQTRTVHHSECCILCCGSVFRLAVQTCQEDDDDTVVLSSEERQKLLEAKQSQIQQIVGKWLFFMKKEWSMERRVFLSHRRVHMKFLK